jgi:hypothetical protein
MRRSAFAALCGVILSLAIASPALAFGEASAYAPPFARWGPASDNGVGVFGHKGYHQAYSWSSASDMQVCVQAWGFSATYPRGHWYGGGCGYSGFVSVPWGNVLAVPRLRAYSLSILTGTFVDWQA